MSTSDLETLKDRITVLQKEFKAQTAKLFAAEAKTVFAAFPTLTAFGWNQYTPYFNDGEECVFRVNTTYGLCIEMDGKVTEEDDVDTYSLKRYIKEGKDWKGNPYTVTEQDKAALLISEFINQFDPAMMKALFGDHVTVRVKADGHVETSEYEHE